MTAETTAKQIPSLAEMESSEPPRWRSLIDGNPIDPVEWREVRSPFSGEIVGQVAWGSQADVELAISAAAHAMRTGLPTAGRADVLDSVARAIREDQHLSSALARTICLEAGKPIGLARLEVSRAAGTFAIAALEARKLAGEMVPLPESGPQPAKLAYTIRRPIGVVGAITPFNFPLNLVAHKVAPAIAAGCAVVLKPADKTPGAAVLLGELMQACGLPPGWLNVVFGEPQEIAQVLAQDARVGIISFTGSDRVGWPLVAAAPRKRVALELGNTSPAIVAEDADLDRAARLLANGAFAFAGQSCVSVQRVYVERSVYPAFLERLVAEAERLRTGDPADEDTDVGPLISGEATERLLEWIGQAVGAGAKVLAGGGVDGTVLRPTVLADVPADDRLAREEAFGPVVCVWPYDEFDDAIARCNSNAHGLQAGLFTPDLSRILTATATLEFGAVIVNDSPSFRRDEMPYGGIKQSGNTREGPARAIREMTEERLVVLEA